jgi:hypothetical protein
MKSKLLIILLVFTSFVRAQLPNYLWAKSEGGDGMDNGNSVATDASGNVIVTGYFTSTTIAFGTTTLTNPNSLGTAEFFIVKYDASGNVLWAKRAGGSANDYGNSVVVDANGNSIVIGYFTSPTITFGTITLINAGKTDFFIVKYDASGNVLWAKSGGGSEFEEGVSVSTDASGNVVATGYFSSLLMTLGTTTLSTAVPISWDIFLVKYDANGNVVWAKREGGSNNDNSTSVTTDASGNILLTGGFYSPTITFGTTTFTNTGNSDFFIVKYDAAGNVLWAKSAGGNAYEVGSGVAIDVNGNSIVMGHFMSPTIAFGTTTLTNGANDNFFLVKYDSGGNVLWAKSEGGSASPDVRGVSTDNNGNVLVTGQFTSPSITFGTTTFTNTGISDFFLLKYNSAGNLLWAKSAGGNSDDMGKSVAIDTNGNIFVTGFFTSPTISFGSTTLTLTVGLDIFLLKLSEAATTAIEETNFTNAVNIFPNPFSEQITLQTNGGFNNITFKMINAMSQTVVQLENISGQRIMFNRGNLPCGLYMIHLLQGNKLLVTKKVVIAD